MGPSFGTSLGGSTFGLGLVTIGLLVVSNFYMMAEHFKTGYNNMGYPPFLLGTIWDTPSSIIIIIIINEYLLF